MEGAAAVEPAEVVSWEKMSKMKSVVDVMSLLRVVHVREWLKA